MAKIKPVYVAGWRNRPTLVCGKSVRFMINEFLKHSTNGEKANIKVFVTTESKSEQAALWTVYESIQYECRLSAPQTPPPMLYIYLD